MFDLSVKETLVACQWAIETLISILGQISELQNTLEVISQHIGIKHSHASDKCTLANLFGNVHQSP